MVKIEAHKKIVIGLGTGRCGTQSLATLLDQQPDSDITHERFKYHLAWSQNDNRVKLLIDKCQKQLNNGLQLTGDVHSAYLPYAEELLETVPNTIFIALKREKEATVKSFLERTRKKANHWAPDKLLERHKRWNKCFPTYEKELTKPHAIARYWDEYYEEVERLQSKYPNRVFLYDLSILNNAEMQSNLLSKLGIPLSEQVIQAGIKTNTGP